MPEPMLPIIMVLAQTQPKTTEKIRNSGIFISPSVLSAALAWGASSVFG